MIYVKTINGVLDKFPYNLGDFRRDNPNISFPPAITEDTLNLFGVYAVVETDIPEYDKFTEIVEPDTVPVKIDNSWILEYKVKKKKQQDAENSIRAERNRLLQETDWMALSDSTLTPEWASYRTALRNLPQSPDFPWNVVWPVKP